MKLVNLRIESKIQIGILMKNSNLNKRKNLQFLNCRNLLCKLSSFIQLLKTMASSQQLSSKSIMSKIRKIKKIMSLPERSFNNLQDNLVLPAKNLPDSKIVLSKNKEQILRTKDLETSVFQIWRKNQAIETEEWKFPIKKENKKAFISKIKVRNGINYFSTILRNFWIDSSIRNGIKKTWQTMAEEIASWAKISIEYQSSYSLLF